LNLPVTAYHYISRYFAVNLQYVGVPTAQNS